MGNKKYKKCKLSDDEGSTNIKSGQDQFVLGREVNDDNNVIMRRSFKLAKSVARRRREAVGATGEGTEHKVNSDDYKVAHRKEIEARGRSGGLLLVWDTNSFSVKQSAREDRFVAIMGTWKGRVGDIILANMYRPYPTNQKVALWKRLEELINSNDAAWCLFGDFNKVRNQDDRLNTQFHVRESDDFNEFIANTHLIEVLMGEGVLLELVMMG
ncbi:RNA-directed DNA polymerase, eukaryota [Tanacetum coccineum]